MATAMTSSPHLQREERGATLVEFVIVLPILAALVLGIMSFGTAHAQRLALTNAAREGARYGATLPVSAPNWAQTVSDVTTASATGELDAGVPGRSVCVALNSGSGWSGTSGAPCFNDGRPANEPRVQVLVGRTTSIEAFFFSKSMNLSGRAVVRYEANP
jgi:Flp pilus assembly protein TadG